MLVLYFAFESVYQPLSTLTFLEETFSVANSTYFNATSLALEAAKEGNEWVSQSLLLNASHSFDWVTALDSGSLSLKKEQALEAAGAASPFFSSALILLLSFWVLLLYTLSLPFRSKTIAALLFALMLLRNAVPEEWIPLSREQWEVHVVSSGGILQVAQLIIGENDGQFLRRFAWTNEPLVSAWLLPLRVMLSFFVGSIAAILSNLLFPPSFAVDEAAKAVAGARTCIASIVERQVKEFTVNYDSQQSSKNTTETKVLLRNLHIYLQASIVKALFSEIK